MADFKVSQNSGASAHSVKLSSGNSFKISQEGSTVANNLSELLDVDVTGVGDKFVIMYDAAAAKFTTVNPDTILSAAAATETTQPGLPQNFIDKLDTDLDDKIDVDAGGF